MPPCRQQAAQSQPKWQERSQVGCYLRLSLQQAMSVSLILHPHTGLVSPQFHCIFNENFETASDLGQFDTLWPTNPKRNSTIVEEYSETNVPSGLKAPCFLRNDDEESTALSQDSTVNEADPRTSTILLPQTTCVRMNHLLHLPIPAPFLMDR
jgi:hypothetical protein